MSNKYVIIALLLCSHVSVVKSQVNREKLIADIQTLSSVEFAGRKPGTDGHEKARLYISGRFNELDLHKFGADYSHRFPLNDTLNGYNIIGYIPGKREEAIVISAHYDHLGERKGRLYLGADDNASGVAGLLALAAYFSSNPPEHTLIFAAFDAEEMGLRGARYFVDHPPVPLKTVLLNVNMDMIGRNDRNELYASGTYHYPHLTPLIKTDNRHIQLKTGHDIPGTGPADWTTQSDHAAFHDRHIPFVYFGVEDHPDYHTPNDTFENSQPNFFFQAVQTILDIVNKMDSNSSLIGVRPLERN